MSTTPIPRILLVDDMPSIHEDFRKILAPAGGMAPDLAAMESALFGNARPEVQRYDIDSAFQGEQALDKVRQALAAGRPYALAFVDMRMPPGWDGVQTIEQLWAVDEHLQVVICTAFSDHSWADVLARLDTRDRLLILKKPFDAIEVVQMAQALANKWQLAREAAVHLSTLEETVCQRTLEITRINENLQRAYAALQTTEERYRMLVESSPDAILIEQEGSIVFANSAASRLFKAQHVNELVGRPMLTLVAPSDRCEAALALSSLACGTATQVEEQALLLDSSTVDVAVTRQAFDYEGRPAVQIIARDISESKRMQQQLKHLATHDVLTGLPNRVLLMDRISQALAHAKRNTRQFMVAVIDLDRFKWINDSLGHDAGDKLLHTVSSRMSAVLRKTDTLARVGGDEFVVLLHDLDDMDAAIMVLNRIVACVSEPMKLDDTNEVEISCSVGCSTYPEDGLDAEALLCAADAAMYQAKESGRNTLQIFNAELRARAAARARLETELRHAIERDELSLHYQPQVDLRTGALVGLEALLRWQHPELGNVSPGRFIAIAEATGLIGPIGEWALNRACQQIREWQDMGLPPVRVAVNISAKQLNRPGLVNVVARSLAAARIDPALLELELTETASMDDPETTIPLLRKLKELGLTLSIDDFGTGYSNMQYLTRLPIDKLKLDGSFVREITTNPGHLAIAEAVIAMTHRLNLKVVAEMTETEGQVVLLSSLGCDHAQGHFFACAMPPQQCTQVLRTGALPLPRTMDRRTSGRSLLVLDDDRNATAAIKLALAGEGFKVFTAHRPDEAFEMLARHPIDVVMSDQCMPGMTGVEFLSTVRRLYPSTMRLIFSAECDFKAAVAAINLGAVHKFLQKPLLRRELRAVLAEIAERRGSQRTDADPLVGQDQAAFAV